MNQHKTSAELKALAKESLMGNYKIAVFVTLLYILMTYIITEISTIFLLVPTIFGTILYYLSSLLISVFTGLFAYGFQLVFLKISCNVSANPGDFYYGFSHKTKEIFKVQLFRSIISFAAFIPYYVFNAIITEEQLVNYIGIYALLFGLGLLGEFMVLLLYNQSFFVMMDFPNYDAKKALAFSRELMKENKGRFIYLLVSFIPICLLGTVTCFVGYLWIIPYIQTTFAHFYLDLVKNKS